MTRLLNLRCQEGLRDRLIVSSGRRNPDQYLCVAAVCDDHVQEIVLTREQAADLAATIHEWLIHGGKNDVLP